MVKNPPEMQEMQVRSLVQEYPLEEKTATHSCLENALNTEAGQATVHRAAKSQTQLKRLSTHACIADSLCHTAENSTTL